jgi:hypothetical protein
MKPMTFKEWNNANNHDGMNAGAAWDAALEEAAKLLNNRATHAYDNDSNLIGEHLEDAALAVRQLKRQ